MKIIILIVTFIACNICAYTQTNAEIDSLTKKYVQAKDDTSKVIALNNLASVYSTFNPDTAMVLAQKALLLSKKRKYNLGEAASLMRIAQTLRIKGNLPLALQTNLQCLKIMESLNNEDGIVRSLQLTGNIYGDFNDYPQAKFYLYKALSYAQPSKEIAVSVRTSIASLNQPDSALVYVQKANEIAISVKNKDVVLYERLMYIVNLNFGKIYLKMKNPALAQVYLHMAENGAIRYNSLRAVSSIYNSLSDLFLQNNQLDSCLYYGRKSLKAASTIGNLSGIVNASRNLADAFKKQQRFDSAFYYKDYSNALKDSAFNAAKYGEIAYLNFREELRQQDLSSEKEQQSAEHNHNVQLSILAIAILSAIVLFLLMSRSIIVSHKSVEFLGLVILLVVFEFINLVLHPFLETFTHNSPVFMLLALVAIAALIVPLHHRIEKWTMQKLVEKNKAIRLANAKKTIKELEGE